MKHVVVLNQKKGNLSLRQVPELTKVEDMLYSSYWEANGKHAIAAINGSLYESGSKVSKPYGTVYYDHGTMLNEQKESTWLVDATYDGNEFKVDGIINKDTWFAIGGFACLRDGQIDNRKWAQNSHLATVQPRTAIAQDYDGNLIMFVTDGRPDGMTASEVAIYLRDEWNVKDALLLDGGGSSTMVVGDTMVNTNENRSVANGLVFYAANNEAIIYKSDNDEKLVCLNAGHLMDTPGKRTPLYQDGSVIHECEQNYPIMFEIERQLNLNHIGTTVTNRDMYKPMPNGSNNDDLQSRIDFEKASGADIYVATHKNAGPVYEWDDSIKGTETICYKLGSNGEKLAAAVHARVIEYSGDVDRKVKALNKAEVRETNAPAIICELEFMTNHAGAMDMVNKEAQYTYACAITHGICDYFGETYNKPDMLEPVDPVIPIENPDKELMSEYINQVDGILDKMRELLN